MASLLLVKSSIQNDEVGWIERSVRVAASMVSLWHVGICRGIISLARTGVKYDDPGFSTIEGVTD